MIVMYGKRRVASSFSAAMFPVNVPNVLTVIRILLVPVLVVALLEKTGDGDLLAAIVFAVASLTDAIDGYLARSRNWVTTFGKLMDPIADKLLIIAALIALVSLDRLEAWVAMVIIAREFAVTVLRVAVGTQQGVVIPASPFGKLKTALQVAMVIGADRGPRSHPLWVELLVYVTVLVTVLSGLDYFFGLRRTLSSSSAARRRRRARNRGVSSRAPGSRFYVRSVEPGLPARVLRRGVAGLDLAPDLAERAEPLGDDVVLVDRLEVDLAGGDERAVVELGEPLAPRRGSSRARSPRRTAAGGAPSRRRGPRRSASSARRSPRTSSARRSRAAWRRRSRRRTIPCSRYAACPGRAGCGWRPAPPRGSCRSRRSRSPRRRAARGRRSATSSCAHGHAVIPWAVTPISRRVPSSLLIAEPWSV